MLVKHLLGFLSLMIFIVLTKPTLYTSTNFVYISVILYAGFMLLSKLNYIIWFLVFGIFAIIYVLYVYLSQIELENQINSARIGSNTVSPDDNDKIPTEDISTKIENIKQLQKYLFITTIPITIVGIFHYIGEKKLDYGITGFNLKKMLIDKPQCSKVIQEYKGFINTLLYAFK
jgi:energy-coupling factor transporter transmembrane protein EcfT